jgi:hypothetical protein
LKQTVENFGAGEGIRTLDPDLGKVQDGRHNVLFFRSFPFRRSFIAHAMPKFISISASLAGDAQR